MKPVAITFADKKFTLLAQEQKDNFNQYGLEHVTISIEEQSYSIELWLKLLDLTVEAIKTYGKIFRVDSEIRMIQPFPKVWTEGNVLFHINRKLNIINTGHMILDNTALLFLENLKELTVAMIPKNYTGEKLLFDDEDASHEAIVKSNISYIPEIIDYERSDASRAACTRGSWYTPHTIFTHPFIHNWNTGSHTISNHMIFRNHFLPGDSVKKADAVLLGLKNKTNNENFWKSLNFIHDGQYWKKDQWLIDPLNGTFLHQDYKTFKQPSQL